MSRKNNIAKNPFKCFDCKTFCTSTYRGLQMHRNSSCAYVKSKKEQLHKKFKLGSSTKMGHFAGVDDFENPKKERFLLSPIIGGADDVTNPRSVLNNCSSMVEDEDNNYHDDHFDAGHNLSY